MVLEIDALVIQSGERGREREIVQGIEKL